jgi:hypothetical protein
MCEYMRMEGALSHETIHLFQYCGTPLGLTLQSLESATSERLLDAARLLADRFGYLRKPLIASVRTGSERGRSARLLQIAAKLELLRRCLQGALQANATLIEDALYTAATALGAPVELAPEDLELTRSPRRHARRPPAKTPAVPSLGARGALLGAHSIWEGAARWVECAYLRGGWRVPRHWSATYVGAPLAFSRLTGINCLPEGIVPSAAGLAFLAVCDAAAFTPLHPRFAERSGPSAAWRDLHPGWRFASACQAIARVEPLCVSSRRVVAVDEAVANYGRFVDELAYVCGWPTITSLAHAVAGPLDRLSDNYERAYRAASQIRLNHPAALGLADFSSGTLADAEELIDQTGTVSDFGARFGSPWALLRAGDPVTRENRPLGADRVVITRTLPAEPSSSVPHGLLMQLAFEPGGFRRVLTPHVVRSTTVEGDEEEDEDPRTLLGRALEIEPKDITT